MAVLFVSLLSFISNDLFTLTDLQFVADTMFLKDNGFLPMCCVIQILKEQNKSFQFDIVTSIRNGSINIKHPHRPQQQP